jgi:hypothetical protein
MVFPSLQKKPPAGRVSFLQAFISMYCSFKQPDPADLVSPDGEFMTRFA